MRTVAEQCSDLIVENESEKLREYIQTLPNHIKMHMIIDDEGYTLLHMASFQNMTTILKLLIDKSKLELDKEEIKEWINYKTEEDGYTSLHYAAWKGNIEIMRILIENNADITIQNAYGLDCIHIAA